MKSIATTWQKAVRMLHILNSNYLLNEGFILLLYWLNSVVFFICKL